MTEFYTGKGQQDQSGQSALPVSPWPKLVRPEDYRPDAGLVDACNVALLLGHPLLLTGEPGTGKTQLAYSLAWELGLGEPLRFNTKSTSVANDLFYHYDALRRFHDAQIKSRETNGVKKDVSVRPYLALNALGKAIVRASKHYKLEGWLAGKSQATSKTRSVVLIDEIDKAPRDFPNDLLNELENLNFRIPELAQLENKPIQANPALQPIVIITSNSEKSLPAPFLRRCIFYNIPFPDKERLEEIVFRRLAQLHSHELPYLDDALDFFLALRLPKNRLDKKPSTAELLGWLQILPQVIAKLESQEISTEALFTKVKHIEPTLSSLIKTIADQQRAKEVLEAWIKEKTLIG